MPNPNRPDLLPFARPVKIGLPWHGLVRDGKLQVESGEREYVSGSDNWTGATLAARHPLANPSLSIANAETENADHRWQNYALLSGDTRNIGGSALAYNYWIYCSATCSWVMSWSLTGTTGAATLKVYVEKEFGRFPKPRESTPRRLVATFVFECVDYEGDSAPGYALDGLSSHSINGALSVINVSGMGYGADNVWGKTQLTVNGAKYCINHVIGVVLTGDTFESISATIETVSDGHDLRILHNGDDLTDIEVYSYKQSHYVTLAGLVECPSTEYRRTITRKAGPKDTLGYDMEIVETQIFASIAVGVGNIDTISLLASWYWSPGWGTYVYTESVVDGEFCSFGGVSNNTPVAVGAGANCTLFASGKTVELVLATLYASASCGDFFDDIEISGTRKTAIGKEGHTLGLDDDFDPSTTAVTYDPVRGLITVGNPLESVVYV